MNVMIRKPPDREAERLQANREELVERIGRAMREDGTTQPFPRLHLYRRSSPLQLLTVSQICGDPKDDYLIGCVKACS
jgi:hypothetical protein